MIQSSSGDFSDELRVLNLSHAAKLVDIKDSLSKTFQDDIERAAKAHEFDKDAWVYQMNRAALSSVLKIHDTSKAGVVTAKLDMSILGHYGEWKLSVQGEADDVVMRRPGMFTKEEMFSFHGVKYVWDMSAGGKTGKLLSEAKEGPKLIAQFSAKGWFKNSCILAIDGEEMDGLDDVVVLGTCVAALNRDI